MIATPRKRLAVLTLIGIGLCVGLLSYIIQRNPKESSRNVDASGLPNVAAPTKQSPDDLVVWHPDGTGTLNLSKARAVSFSAPGVSENVIRQYLEELEAKFSGAELDRAKRDYLIALVNRHLTLEQTAKHLGWFSAQLGDKSWDKLSEHIAAAFSRSQEAYEKLFSVTRYEPYLDRIAKYWSISALRDNFKESSEFLFRDMPNDWLRACALTAFPAMIEKDLDSGLRLFAKCPPSASIVDESARKLTVTKGIEAAIESLNGDLRWTHIEQGIEAAVNQSAAANPESAIRIFESSAYDQHSSAIIAGLISGWIQHSPAAASEWLNKLPPSSSRDSGVTSLINGMYLSNPSEALTWAATLSDDNAKNSLMRRVYYSYSASDPEGASRALQQLEVPQSTLDAIRANK